MMPNKVVHKMSFASPMSWTSNAALSKAIARSYVSTIAAALIALSTSLVHAEGTASAIYLRCNVANEPEGVNDVHIDFAKKTLTNFFGTSHPIRDEGPFIISEAFAEINGKREVVTTTRINRYTLSFQYIWPAQQILKNGQCAAIEKKM